MNTGKIIHVLLLLGAGAVLTLVGPRLWRNLSESEPLAVDVGDSVGRASVGDRQWLALRGRPALEEGVIARSGASDGDRSSTAAGGDGTSIYVPVVATGWRPGDPVNAFALMGPYPRGDAERQVREAASIMRLRRAIKQDRDPPSTITGARVDLSTASFLRDHFNLAPDALIVSDGTKPAPVPHLLFTAVVCALVMGYSAIRVGNPVLPGDMTDLSQSERD